MKRLVIPALLVLVALVIPTAFAQNRMTYSVVSPQSGHIALGLAIRKLNVSGTFMQAPAHPDDETNALFALFTHGMGLRSVDVQNNRGEGGQNEIGPELFRDWPQEHLTQGQRFLVVRRICCFDLGLISIIVLFIDGLAGSE